MRLYVIAGHGQGDPGACANGCSEAERVRALANRLVELGGGEVGCYDQSKDLYQQGGPLDLGVGKDVPCLELHMDSAGASARGGHVIVKDGLSPDAYDSALASFVAGFFPGRAQSIVGRNDLQNVNVAAQVGQNYRLLECCFVTNQDDVERFNSRTDEFARGILACFGIETEEDMPTASEIAEAVWNFDQNGTLVRDRVQGTDAAANAARDEVTRTDDPTGRGVEMTTHEHVKWMAAKQAEMDERQRSIEEKVDAVLDALKKG